MDHFGRSQFYIALKLVSLAQNGYEISLENLSKPNLPLPHEMQATLSSGPLDYDKQKQHLNSIDFDSFSSSTTNSTSSFHDKINHTDHHDGHQGILPPPPSSHRAKKISPSQLCKFCNKNLITASSATTVDQEQVKNLRTFVLICPNCKHSNQNSPNELQPLSNTVNQKNQSDQTSSSDNSRCSSAELYETIDNTSLAFEKLKPWEKILSEQTTQDYVGSLDDADESKHCLLNEEEEQVDSNKICLNINSNHDQYDSSYFKPTSSDAIEEETDDEDVWSMNDDQVRYYFEKFCQLLASKQDTLLAGNNVKSFFEKSKLSLVDLKQIWTLSDLDADGHLSLIEFCIAMHLVVMRRNKVPLPDQLPCSLLPSKINQLLVRNQLPDCTDQNYGLNSADSNHSSSLQLNYHLSSGNVSTINVPTVSNVSNVAVSKQQPSELQSSSLINSFDLRNQECGKIEINSPNNREWTKFNNSPYISTNSSCRLQQLQTQGNHPLNHLNTNQQINPQTNDVNCLMTPANFTDKIELDPTLIHPLAVKVSPASSQQFAVDSINSQVVNKDANNRVFKNSSATVLKYVFSYVSTFYYCRNFNILPV